MLRAPSLALPLALCLAATPAAAQEARRQLDAHAHGAGKLAIALEGNRLQMELEQPAIDIVGFEHAPSNRAQRKAIADARARLAKAGELFKLPAAAGCKLATVKVEVHGAAAASGKSGGHDHGHDHEHAKKPATAAKPDPKTAAKTPEPAADDDHHSEFRATYALDCAQPANLRTIGFDYFKAFRNVEKLDVTVIGPKGQSQSTVTPAKAILDLAGTT